MQWTMVVARDEPKIVFGLEAKEKGMTSSLSAIMFIIHKHILMIYSCCDLKDSIPLTETMKTINTFTPFRNYKLFQQYFTLFTTVLFLDKVCSLGQEDPLEKEMVTHSSILAWEIPWMEEPGGL